MLYEATLKNESNKTHNHKTASINVPRVSYRRQPMEPAHTIIT